MNQRITSSIPSQGTGLGCRPGVQFGARERQPHVDVSLPFSLPSLLSKNKQIKNIFLNLKKEKKLQYFYFKKAPYPL